MGLAVVRNRRYGSSVCVLIQVTAPAVLSDGHVLVHVRLRPEGGIASLAPATASTAVQLYGIDASVLASMALADHPRVMLPIIFYNMIQHLVAGGAYSLFGSRTSGYIGRMSNVTSR